MKKIIAIIAAAVMALSAVAVLAGCDAVADQLKETGNKAVNSAKDYLKSEVGVDGDASTLVSKADDYARNELGLNGDNDVIEGTWKQTDATNGDWVWTFDGKGGCHLQGITTGFNTDGSYSVDANAATVTVNMDGWDNQKVYTYKLKKTLSDETLDLTETYSSYHLIKQ